MVHDGSWWLMMVNHLVGGFSPPLWNMMEFVSWDDDIPNTWKIHKIHVPNHQPVVYDVLFDYSHLGWFATVGG